MQVCVPNKMLVAGLVVYGVLFLTPFLVNAAQSDAQPYVTTHWQEHHDAVRSGMIPFDAWYEVPGEEVSELAGMYDSNIVRMLRYVPREGLKTRQPVVCVVIHGTWAARSSEFCSDASPGFRSMKRFALELGERKGAPVELISFTWSGGATFSDRQTAARQLQGLLNLLYGPLNGFSGSAIIAHSHGCNITNIALQELSFVVDMLVYMASPVMEFFSEYAPTNFSTLYNIYSTDDVVQSVARKQRGYISEAGLTRNGKRQKRKMPAASRVFGLQNGRAVYNIRLQVNGRSPGHIRLKSVVHQLWPLCDTIHQHYRFHNHFDANIFLKDQSQDLLQPSPNDIPLVAVRDKLTESEVLDLVGGAENKDIMVQQLKGELAFSAQQEYAYAERYRGRSIHKGRLIGAIMENWSEARSMLMTMFPLLRIDNSFSILESACDDGFTI